MAMSNYPGGFKDGIVIRGMPLSVLHPGKVFWVSNASAAQLPGHKGASDGNQGTFDAPFATIDYAVGRCTAGRGDVIMVKPGYTQTITLATEILLDVAGVAIVGLGTGSLRPTITFETNATANIPVTAANVSVYNMLFVANIADAASVFTATGTATPTDFTVENCEFRDTSSSLNFLAVVTGNATANSMDGLYFGYNRISSLGTTAATTAISILQAANRVRVTHNYGVWAVLNNTPTLMSTSTFNLLSLEVDYNTVFRPNTDTSTGGILLEGTGAAMTGMVHHNHCKTLDAAGMLIMTLTSALGFHENYLSGTADKSGLLIPAADDDGS
jgi:hypothetical protein